MRGPDADETPLSAAEVQAGVMCGEFDSWPMEQRWLRAGAWERRTTGLLAAPAFWDALL
ncbi:hypothetical protein LJR074_001950 [Acidovorax sp. LjRoot74]|uniref:hypothetical protein n=1 Tax=Acidovorax sp. LjRoot74 TaxID=3342337 RepID=UPI003ED0FA58